MTDVYQLQHLPVHFRVNAALRYEVQLVDSFGQSLDSAVFGDEESPVELNGRLVPIAVLKAAKTLEVNESRCVDADGNGSCPSNAAEPVELSDDGTPRRFFVFHMRDGEPRKSATARYEIEIVNKHGQGVVWGVVGDDETTMRIENYDIPLAVLEAARRLPVGKGDYVDANGDLVYPSSRNRG